MIAVTDEEAKAVLTVGAVLMALSTGGGAYVGSKYRPPPIVIPAPPPEIQHHIVEVPRFIYMPLPSAKVEDRLKTDAETPPVPPKEGEGAPQTVTPPPPPPPPAVTAPARPKAPAKALPKPEKKQPAKKPKPSSKSGLPSCAEVKRQYDSMTRAQRFAAYMRATDEEVAHGKRCLGM